MIERKLSKKVSINSNLTIMGQGIEGENKTSGESLISSSRNLESNMNMRTSDEKVDMRVLNRELS